MILSGEIDFVNQKIIYLKYWYILNQLQGRSGKCRNFEPRVV